MKHLIKKILKESLNWSDSDESYGNDENYSNDQSWKNFETGTPSYWEQGDAGGSGNGEDMNESDDMDWIRDVSEEIPDENNRTIIDLKYFLLDFMEGEPDLVELLYELDVIAPTEEYTDGPGDMEEWFQGEWENPEYMEWLDGYPYIAYYEILEYLENGCDKWEFLDYDTLHYQLDTGTYTNRYIFKRKSDGRFFSIDVYGDKYDGATDNDNKLIERFEKKIITFV